MLKPTAARPPLRSVGSHGAPYFTQKGPMGPPTLPSRGPRAPYFTQEGPMGPPHGALFPEKNFRGFAAKIFFRFTVEFGVPGPPTLPSRGPRAPYFTQEGPMGPHLRLVGFPTKKKFTRACAREFFLSESVVFFKFKNIIF